MGGINAKRKYLGRANEKYIESYSSEVIRVDDLCGYSGWASFIKINKVKRPWIVGERLNVCIADDGYSELCFLPDDEKWQVYAIYDEKNQIVEWYFDIARENGIDENGNRYCEDMYLDAALLPDGRVLILDEDELTAALNDGSVTRDEFDEAHGVLRKMTDDKIISVEFMERLCGKLICKFGRGNHS